MTADPTLALSSDEADDGGGELAESEGGASPTASRAGTTPGAVKQFWWDLLPKRSLDRVVPRRSGLIPPVPDVDWIAEEIAEAPQALEQTWRAHDLERERAASIEAKAGSMVTLCLTLLATALAVAGYQVGFLRDEPPLPPVDPGGVVDRDSGAGGRQRAGGSAATAM